MQQVTLANYLVSRKRYLVLSKKYLIPSTLLLFVVVSCWFLVAVWKRRNFFSFVLSIDSLCSRSL